MFFRGVRVANLRGVGSLYRAPVSEGSRHVGSFGGRPVFHLSGRSLAAETVRRVNLQTTTFQRMRFFSTEREGNSKPIDDSKQPHFDIFENSKLISPETLVKEAEEFYQMGFKQAAARHVKLAADQGHPDAQNILGFMKLKGEGVPVDKKAAAKLMFQADTGEESSSFADFNRALLLAEGKDVPRDMKRAVYYFERAARKGSSRAKFNLAILLERGEGVEKDKKRALQLLNEAADEDNSLAMYRLAAKYVQGEGVQVDRRKAAEYLERAADLNLSDAQFNLGVMCEKGDPMKADRDRAVLLYERAARALHIGAMRSLARLYRREALATDDESKAAELRKQSLYWYEEAASFQDPDDISELAKMTRQWESVS